MPDQPRSIAISIGGSGARTAEALLYLCAAGLGPESMTLLFVDADTSNGSLKKVVELAELYVRLQPSAPDDCRLFHTRLNLLNPPTWSPFPGGHGQPKLSSFFDYPGLLANGATRSLAKLMEVLYTEDHRNAALDDGFLGKPSIGAAVLGHAVATQAQPWGDLVSGIRNQAANGQQVSVFAMGSVFGGTGAAGLPTIPKLLRDSVGTGKSNVCLGAALLLPYFLFPEPEDVNKTGRVYASSKTFVLNSKEALRHYHSLDVLFDRLYLVGSAKFAPQKEFHKGGVHQDNLPHFVELIAASGANDFFRNGKPDERSLRLAAVQSDDAFTWSDYPEEILDRPALSNLARLCFFYLSKVMPALESMKKGSSRALRIPWYEHLIAKAGTRLGDEEKWGFFKDLDLFSRRFLIWLREIQANHGDVNLQLAETAALADLTLNGGPARLNDGRFAGGLLHNDPSHQVPLAEMWTRLCEQRLHNSLKSNRGFESALYQAAATKGD